MTTSLPRRALAEFLGTAILVATVVGSGIMATRLTPDVGLQLLINALATVAALGVLIWSLAPVSGAHFNPAVTLVSAARSGQSWSEAAVYVVVQIVGGLAGAVLAHLMYAVPAVQVSPRDRSGLGQWIGEVVATAGLIAVIGALNRTGSGRLGPALVPAWIGAAYFFTSSTSFANPAVTLGRAITDSFSGIAPASVPGFVAAQVVGAVVGAVLVEVFYGERPETPQ